MDDAEAVLGTGSTDRYAARLPVAGRLVVVAGGGTAAFRRVCALVRAAADVLVVAPELTAALEDLVDRAIVRWVRRGFDEGDLDGAWLVAACTGRPAGDAAVAAAADRARIWCLPAEDAPLGDVAVPGPAGTAGRVALVGGGPGDPGLLTVRGRDLLLAADVVVADRLAPVALLDQLPARVRVIDAGKIPGGRSMRQQDINDALVRHARAGHAVVRLKGGDPFVFGRGMEEVQACAAAGIPVEVVPGVSSCISVPGLAQIPVTHRNLTQAFTVVSGHVPPGDRRSTVDWAVLARTGGTLVLLMSLQNLGAITAALLAGGLSPATPAACVEDGASTRQRTVRGTLGDLAGLVHAAGMRPPAVVVIGAVAGLLDQAPADDEPAHAAVPAAG